MKELNDLDMPSLFANSGNAGFRLQYLEVWNWGTFNNVDMAVQQ